MASIAQDSLYINMLTINREEAAILLSLVLGGLLLDDEQIKQIEESIGISGVRPRLEAIGQMIDDDFNEMLASVNHVALV